jgi:small basic protein (TIGR04137 family)
MTMDKSLRTRKGMARSRSVLNRAERIARLQQADKWQEGETSPFGLPKVRVYKLSMKKKKKRKEDEEGAEAGKPAAGGKAAGKK